MDYHLHTYLCRHAGGTLPEYVEYARKRGLREIGFADHFPLSVMDFVPQIQVTMEPDELDTYLEMVSEVASSAEGMTVKTGIELDYIPAKMQKASSILAQYPFDYVIGSVHFMDDWDLTHPYHIQGFEERCLEDVYERYFTMVQEACQSGCIDIIGHVDAVKKFNYCLSPELLMTYYEEVAKVLSDTGVCLEVNTAGFDAPVKEMYPHQLLLEECVRRGVNIVMGSDAHAPEEVGRYFPYATGVLREAGVTQLTHFERRKPYQVSLEG